jgi:hypothetical protein
VMEMRIVSGEWRIVSDSALPFAIHNSLFASQC